MPPRQPDLASLALALIRAEDQERAIRLRLISCRRASDYVLASAFDFAHDRAVESRRRAMGRLRALRMALGEVHAPRFVAG